MNSTTKRSKSSIARSTMRPGHILNMSWWLNPKSYQKPKLALTLNNMMAIKSLKRINNTFDDNQYSSENRYLIGGEDALSSSDGVDAAGAVGACQRIPKGSVAVYVGPELQRFVIPACYLAIPDIRALMDKAAEEFGYHHQGGGIQIPNCDQHDFRFILAGVFENVPDLLQGKAHTKNTSGFLNLF